MLKPGSNERGAVIVLFAVMLVVIVVCTALVVDIGHIHNAKAELQRAVDAAALAAAARLPDGQYANAAVAVGAENSVDGAPAVIQTADVVRGWWDPEIGPGKTPATRFDPTSTPYTAVRVSATYNVDHAFFFFTPFTTVQADAVALAEPINPVMPLTIVSCIPVASTMANPGALPGTSPCDIRYYSFSPDTDDTGAWTGLTFNQSANEIRAMLEGPEGRELYEKVVFGEGLSNTEGIENTAPVSGECRPQDLDINCGLGMIGGLRLAPPESFPSPPGFPSTAEPLPKDATTGIYQPGGFDPMNGYRQNGALPRWYNLNDDGTLQTDDHFVRLWTLDGLLLMGETEGGTTDPQLKFLEYQKRLAAYYNADPTYTIPAPFNDGRLTGSDGLISNSLKMSEKQAIADYYGVAVADVNYWPNAQKIINNSGYPKVYVTNGTVADLLATFFENEEIATDETLNCSDNAPLAGDTLRLQVPVIFAGYCESWKALSNTSAQNTLNYVGLADFLVTRAWKTPQDYACAGNFVSGAGCGSALSTPAPLVGGEFRQVNRNDMAIEGLITVPNVTGAAGNSAVKVYLVE